MAISIVTLAICGIISYFIYISWRDKRKYYNKHKEVFDAHRRLGYPTLSKDEQFNILDSEDFSSILKLTKYDFVPTGLLKHYITIDSEDYLIHLRNTDIIEKMDINKLKNKMTDGFYIEIDKNRYKYIFNDKQSRIFEKEFKSEDKLLKHIIKQRLKIV